MIGTMAAGRRHQRWTLRAGILLLTSPLFACATQSQVQRAAPQSTATPQVQKEVLVLPLGPKTTGQLSYWTTQDQRLVLAYFDIFLRHGFKNMTTSRVVVPEVSYETNALELALQQVDADRDPEWWAYVPLSGRVQHAGRYPDYVLILDGLRYRVRSAGGSRQSYDTPGGGKVELDLDFVLWDNQNEEVAAAGRLHEESSTSSPHLSSEIFQDLFEKMAEDVVRNSPIGS
ncbi:MAG: hypothetical protein HKO65_10270 [Gemmatimonadetes bacterium]|nr:hypothetical protein [Gemmatimonadota bacterium]NNM05477.1 hypothetical protein [Gemmatimonadota bacterium]